MAVTRVGSDAPWEERVGYSRAVRSGDHVYVTGTVSVEPDGGVHAPGDAYAQTRRALEIVLRALNQVGAGVSDVVRTRLFVTDISRWEEVGRAHREVFHRHPPATTMVEVRALIHPDLLVEVEADAVVQGGSHREAEAQGSRGEG